MSENKYNFAINQQKLERAIKKAKSENLPAETIDARVKELYILSGGKINLEDVELPKTTSPTTSSDDVPL